VTSLPQGNIAVQQKSPEARRSEGRVFALILIVSLYGLWGMAHNLNDILMAQFKKAFELSDLQFFDKKTHEDRSHRLIVPAGLLKPSLGTSAVSSAALSQKSSSARLVPLTFQGWPDALLPPELQDDNSQRIPRRRDGILGMR